MVKTPLFATEGFSPWLRASPCSGPAFVVDADRHRSPIQTYLLKDSPIRGFLLQKASYFRGAGVLFDVGARHAVPLSVEAGLEGANLGGTGCRALPA